MTTYIAPMQYRTLTGTMRSLKTEGYIHNFRFLKGKMKDVDTGNVYTARELKLKARHRFSVPNEPNAGSILHAFEAEDGTKGLFILDNSAYGAKEISAYMRNISSGS